MNLSVQVYPADDSGCGHYRMIWPARVLQRRFHDVEILGMQADTKLHVDRDLQGNVTGLKSHPGCDVVVIQRPLTQTLVRTIELLQEEGVRVVVEIDDDFTALPPTNLVWKLVHTRSNTEHDEKFLREACRMADKVVVTTPALADRYGAHGRVSVVPNYVPSSYLDIEPEHHDPPLIGWSGVIETHKGDPEVMRGALERIDAPFCVIGGERGVKEAFGRDADAIPWVPLPRYPHAMSKIDIGIVPLADNAFNRAKSWLKGLEFASLGVPFVASPTPPYRELHDRGMGVLARKPKHWERELRRLVEDPDRREELSRSGREAASHLTIEEHASKFWDAWIS